MAHEQGNQPTDDPSKYGLKFDSEKPRWELLPKHELMRVVDLFTKTLMDITKFNRESLINSIYTDMMTLENTHRDFKGRLLCGVAFKLFFLLRNKPYTKEELEVNIDGLRWDLLDMKQVEKVVEVYTMGAKKYEDHNWKKVSAERYYGAFMRHFSTIRTGERYDSEFGCLHIHQAIWNILALIYLDNQIPDEIVKASKIIQNLPVISVELNTKKIIKKKASKKKPSPNIRKK